VPDLADTIESEAQLPKSTESDGQKAEGQPLPDLIEADKYLKASQAASGSNDAGGPKSAWRGVRMGRGIPPGSVDRS
jgi:hypothetical protein